MTFYSFEHLSHRISNGSLFEASHEVKVEGGQFSSTQGHYVNLTFNFNRIFYSYRSPPIFRLMVGSLILESEKKDDHIEDEMVSELGLFLRSPTMLTGYTRVPMMPGQPEVLRAMRHISHPVIMTTSNLYALSYFFINGWNV